MNTRVMVIADLHSGHNGGLTPPDWDSRPGDAYGSRVYGLWQMRRKMWKAYAGWCAELQPDVLIVNGDAIDGKGKKSGSTELLTSDRTEQIDMAVACIKETNAKRIVMSYGTAYHTGYDEDWEKEIADKANAESIGGEDDLNVSGLIINYRHHSGRSSIPHGRGTPLARARLWNVLWAQRGEYPKAKIIIRSHVHYHTYIGETDWVAISTPALQAYGSKYGTRIMESTVDFGVIYIDVSENGEYIWDRRIQRFNHKRQFALQI